MFDLEAAVVEFRARMGNGGTCSAPDVDELESHLRDSVERLVGTGLSTEEAFLVAARRLGPADRLAVEYASAYPERVWRDRAMWMLAGLLACGAISSVSELVPALGLFMATLLGVHGSRLALVSLISSVLGIVAMVAAAIGLYRLVSRRSIGLRPMAWVLLGLGMIVAIRGATMVSFVVAMHHLSPHDMGESSLSRNYVGFAWSIVLPVAYGVLILRLRRRAAVESC